MTDTAAVIDAQIKKLHDLAVDARKLSWRPHSKFLVAAAPIWRSVVAQSGARVIRRRLGSKPILLPRPIRSLRKQRVFG